MLKTGLNLLNRNPGNHQLNNRNKCFPRNHMAIVIRKKVFSIKVHDPKLQVLLNTVTCFLNFVIKTWIHYPCNTKIML